MYIQALLQEAQSNRGFRVSDVPPPFLFCDSPGGEKGVDSTTTDHAPPTIHIGRRDLQPHSNVIEDLSQGGVVESEKKTSFFIFINMFPTIFLQHGSSHVLTTLFKHI